MEARVQAKTSSTATSVSTWGTSSTSAIGAGNLVAAVVHYCTSAGSAITASSFADQATHVLSFQQVQMGAYNKTTEFGTQLWYMLNAPASITEIIVTMSAACNLGLGVTWYEYSGIALSLALVGSNSSNATATTAANNINSGLATPTNEPALVLALSTNDSRSNHAPSAGTGFTAQSIGFNHPNTGAPAGTVEDARITTLAAIAATFTNTGTSGDHCPSIMGIFAEPFAAPGYPPTPRKRRIFLPTYVRR